MVHQPELFELRICWDCYLYNSHYSSDVDVAMQGHYFNTFRPQESGKMTRSEKGSMWIISTFSGTHRGWFSMEDPQETSGNPAFLPKKALMTCCHPILRLHLYDLYRTWFYIYLYISSPVGLFIYPWTSVLDPFRPGTICNRAGTICSLFMEIIEKSMEISPSCKREDQMAH
jgi:hypothetical protein